MSERLIPEACVDKSLDYITPPTNGSRIYDGVTGEVLKELVSEGKLLRVSRRKLRRLVSEGINVHFGFELSGITYGGEDDVTAHFTNGQSVRGSVLVGADGPRSMVRARLFDHDPSAQPTPLEGIVHLAATFSYNDAQKSKFVRTAHPVWSMMIHPEIFTYICIQDVPDSENPENWTYFLFVCWRGEKSDLAHLPIRNVKKMAQDKAEHLQEPFRSAILWIPDDIELKFFDIGRWVARPWWDEEHTRREHGTVTLAGDAAHPMPPYRGQGLNHAVQDAWNFVEMMKKVKDGTADQDIAIREYSAEMIKRGTEETELGTRNAYMMLAYDEFKESPYMKVGLTKQ